ncbi:hypothetical protein V6N13_051596 [Hibiscus sabdariffa]
MSTIWNVVRTNIVWTIGSGRTTDFWRDPWLDEIRPLVDYVPAVALASIGPSSVTSMIWSELIRPEQVHDFLSLGIPEWIRANIGGTCSFARNAEKWNLVFGYTLWNLWLHRNAITFCNAPGNFGNIRERTIAMVASLDRSTRLLRSVHPVHGRADIGQEQWSLPQHQWLKVNTDGARSGMTGHASCGGVGRDSEGNWELCSRAWTVHINHTKRSRNNVADKLAKNANLDCLEPTLFDTPPPWVISLLLEDVHH